MKQKVIGVVPLMVVMLLVAAFAVGDNSVAAESVDQAVTVTVNENIALSVSDAAAMANKDNIVATSNSYSVVNEGNVPINVLVNPADTEFKGTNVDGAAESFGFGLGDYKIKARSGSYLNIPTSITTSVKITDNGKLPKKDGNSFSSDQTLKIPRYTSPGTYTNTLVYVATTAN
ncbi:MAG: hypothetical protein ACPK7O_05045 [Methanobacterium sp.]